MSAIHVCPLYIKAGIHVGCYTCMFFFIDVGCYTCMSAIHVGCYTCMSAIHVESRLTLYLIDGDTHM